VRVWRAFFEFGFAFYLMCVMWKNKNMGEGVPLVRIPCVSDGGFLESDFWAFRFRRQQDNPVNYDHNMLFDCCLARIFRDGAR
jgi:hypothetical protein